METKKLLNSLQFLNYIDNRDKSWTEDNSEICKALDEYADQKYYSLKEENERLREALTKVRNWELPSTGKFWDKEETQPMSYEAAYGTNGSRDYFKQITESALQSLEEKKL
jgi:hypothetical protein